MTSTSEETTDAGRAGASRCAICGDTKENHEGRVHAFTTKQGDLKTPEQASKEAQPQRPQALNFGALGLNPMGLGRLIEVLMEKNLLSDDEALYIAGFRSKPENKSGFADPAMGG